MSPVRCRELSKYYRGLALTAWIDANESFESFRFLARFWSMRAIEDGQ